MIALPPRTPGFIVETAINRIAAVVETSGTKAFVVWDGRIRAGGDPLLRTVWAKRCCPLSEVMQEWWFVPKGTPHFYFDRCDPFRPLLCWESGMGPMWAWQGGVDDAAAPDLELLSRGMLAPIDREFDIENRGVG